MIERQIFRQKPQSQVLMDFHVAKFILVFDILDSVRC